MIQTTFRSCYMRLGLKEDDTLYLTEASGGGYRLTPDDPEFAR